MNVSGRRILKTTAAVVGISALGALGTGTAFAATPANLGGAPTTHGTSTADAAGLTSPESSKSGDLHSFAVPKMGANVVEPSYRNYDDNNYDDNNNDDNGYRSSNSRYDDNNDDSNYDNSDYNDNGYDDNYGYDRYRNNDNGGLGNILGGNN